MEHQGWGEFAFTDWIIFKMIVRIYGEEYLIKALTEIKENGGIKEMRARS